MLEMHGQIHIIVQTADVIVIQNILFFLLLLHTFPGENLQGLNVKYLMVLVVQFLQNENSANSPQNANVFFTLISTK